MERSRARRLTHLGLLGALATACDAFDFGRVTGTTAPSVAPSTPPAEPARRGASASPDPAPVDPLVLAIFGRITLGARVGARLEASSTGDPLSGIRPALSGTHLELAGLDGQPTGQAPKGSEARALALRGGGISALVSREAPPERSALEAAGVQVVLPSGVERAGARELAAPGWRIVVLPSVDATSPEEVEQAVGRARQPGAVVLLLHAGALEGPGEVVARRALGAGADAALGVGGRIPLGVSWVDGRPAVHGLGALLADEDPREPWTARGLFARLRLFRDGRRDLHLCPYRLAEGSPRLLAGPSRPTEEGIFSRTLLRLSAPHGGVVLSEPDLHSCFRATPPSAGRRDGG
jgi:hypothetical protein